MIGNRPAEILLVEDSDNDAELTKISFSHVGLVFNLHHVRNGEECMTFLRKQGEYANAPTPDLVLLDLKMPRMNGQEVLQEVNSEKHLRQLPIVVWTSSDMYHDVITSYRLGCRSYIVKPSGFNKFLEAIQSITNYWFAMVTLPTLETLQC